MELQKTKKASVQQQKKINKIKATHKMGENIYNPYM